MCIHNRYLTLFIFFAYKNVNFFLSKLVYTKSNVIVCTYVYISIYKLYNYPKEKTYKF